MLQSHLCACVRDEECTPARTTIKMAICLIHKTYIVQVALIAKTLLRENGSCCRELFC